MGKQLENGNGRMTLNVDHLLISTPNILVGDRVRGQLEAAGIRTGGSELGLEVQCGMMRWQLVAESIAAMLSPAERHDTRVALVSVGRDRGAVHRAIFRAKGLDELLREMRESWLEEVMSDGGLEIHFQPLVQYPPGRVHGYECLMRGVDREGRLISPGKMFLAAQTLNRVRELDERCRAEALRACARMADDRVTFFVNFIPSAVVSGDEFVESLLRELQKGRLRAGQIVLEVVETDRSQDQRHLAGILRRLRKAGFKVALDDVGSGYSSLLSLCRLRPDYIKLDGELVRRAAFSTLEAKMIADLADAARENGIITVAEGIETEQQLKLVLDCGIRLTQGYVHAQPEPRLLGAERLRGVLRKLSEVAHRRSGCAAAAGGGTES